jgi:hypothetical protein
MLLGRFRGSPRGEARRARCSLLHAGEDGKSYMPLKRPFLLVPHARLTHVCRVGQAR